jgi:hypothetical protein
MILKRFWLIALVWFCTSRPANAQKYNYPYGVEAQGVAGAVGVDTLAAQSPQNRSEADIRAALNINNGTNVTKLVFFVSGYKNFLEAIQNDRNDVQTGSSPSSSGTTSVASKGVAAQVLSLATEQGALSRTDSTTVSTFTGNPTGIARLLAGDEVFPYCAIYDFSCESVLARVLDSASASVSFNLTPNNGTATTTPPTNNSQVLTASSGQVAAWGARYDFNVRKRPAEIAKNYSQQFNSTVSTMGVSYATAVQTLLSKIPAVQLANWQTKYVALLQSDATADKGAFTKALTQAVSELADLAEKADPQFKTESDLVMTSMSSYFVNRDKVMDDYVHTVTLSVSYNDTRPANQPTQSSATFILSARVPTFAQVTANGTAEWYDHSLTSGVNRFRDAQFALEFDHTFGKPTAELSPTLSAGYYFQYMVSNGLLTLPSSALAPGTSIALPGNASELLNTKGAINLGQVKVTFKIKSTGISIPLALTFSNRTDLISNATEVHGNFGLTYDIDSLLSKL